MNILLWIVLGLVAGWLASMFMGTDAKQGALGDIVLGIVGALVGGFLMSLLGAPGVTGFNLWSVLVSFVGAVVLIWIGRMLKKSV